MPRMEESREQEEDEGKKYENGGEQGEEVKKEERKTSQIEGESQEDVRVCMYLCKKFEGKEN